MLKPLLQKSLSFRIGRCLALIVGLGIHVVVMALMGTYAGAMASDTAAGTNEKNQIRIMADKLFAEVDSGEIEFIGNVKATQAEAAITADRLTIFYDTGAIKSQTNILKTESIKKITASGHVKIIYEDIIAETDKAEYTINSGVLVLTGPQSKITQGDHSISGTKFTLQRQEGKLTAESSVENRVKAVIKPPKNDQ